MYFADPWQVRSELIFISVLVKFMLIDTHLQPSITHINLASNQFPNYKFAESSNTRWVIKNCTDYSSTPGGTIFGTTPGGTKIVYERAFLVCHSFSNLNVKWWMAFQTLYPSYDYHSKKVPTMFQVNMRNSPLSRTPPTNLPNIPGFWIWSEFYYAMIHIGFKKQAGAKNGG